MNKHDYHVMFFEECPKCKEYEEDHKFTNCGFTVDRKSDGKIVQSFECTRCKHKWERMYN